MAPLVYDEAAPIIVGKGAKMPRLISQLTRPAFVDHHALAKATSITPWTSHPADSDLLMLQGSFRYLMPAVKGLANKIFELHGSENFSGLDR